MEYIYFCSCLSGQTFTRVPVNLSTFPYVYLFTCPPFYMTTFLHFYSSTCIHVNLPTYRLAYISTCLLVNLSSCQLAYRFTCSPGLPVYQPTTKLAYQYTSLILVYQFTYLPVICVSMFLCVYESILIIFNNHFRTRNVIYFFILSATPKSLNLCLQNCNQFFISSIQVRLFKSDA